MGKNHGQEKIMHWRILCFLIFLFDLILFYFDWVKMPNIITYSPSGKGLLAQKSNNQKYIKRGLE